VPEPVAEPAADLHRLAERLGGCGVIVTGSLDVTETTQRLRLAGSIARLPTEPQAPGEVLARLSELVAFKVDYADAG
jgi:hypothetical protein